MLKGIGIVILSCVFAFAASHVCAVPNKEGFYESCDYLATNFSQPLAQRRVYRWKSLCAKGDLHSCYNLSIAFATGNGIYKSFHKANAIWHKLCAKGDAKSCYNLANSYLLRHGVDTNLTLARQYFDKACALDYTPACAKKKPLH